MENGVLIVFSSVDLQKLYQVSVFDEEISKITIDPTNLVIVASKYSQEVAAITFIESKIDYVYIDLGKKKFCTVMFNKDY